MANTEWRRFQYDDQGTNFSPYTPNTFGIFGSFSVNDLTTFPYGGSNTRIFSPIVVNNGGSDDIFYFLTAENCSTTSAQWPRILAVRANGHGTGIPIGMESVLWTYVPYDHNIFDTSLTYNAYPQGDPSELLAYPSYNFLSLSDDGATLYYSNGQRYFYAINTADGSHKWLFDTGFIHGSGSLVPYFANGCLHILMQTTYSFYYSSTLYVIKLSPDTGAQIERYAVRNAGYGYNAFYCWAAIFNSDRTSLYLSFYDSTASARGTFFTRVSGLGSAQSYASSDTIVSTDGFIAGGMAYVNYNYDDLVFLTSPASQTASQGLYKIHVGASVDLIHNGGQSFAPPAIHDLGSGVPPNIIYRCGSNIYSIRASNSSVVWSSGILPSDYAYKIAPMICGDGNVYAYSCNAAGGNDVHVFADNNIDGGFLRSGKIGSGSGGSTYRTICATPSMGNASITPIVYVPILDTTSSRGWGYLLGSRIPPVTTTTTTTPSGPTTTTTTTPVGPTTTTTTTTGTGTTTTTTTKTTTPPPLATVQTTLFENNVPSQTSNASDSSDTQNSLLAKSFSFGTVAANETSKTIIVALNVPYVKAITNIRLGLTSTGGINFADGKFGVISSLELRDDITPDNQFLGVNDTKDSGSIFNMTVPNKDSHTSEYVYLNVKLPQDQIIGSGLIRYKWFFDFAD